MPSGEESTRDGEQRLESEDIGSMKEARKETAREGILLF